LIVGTGTPDCRLNSAIRITALPSLDL
jgi:hypothetical protein